MSRSVRRVADSALLVVGRTVQAFADHEGDLLLTLPQFMRDFYERRRDDMQEDDE